MPWFTKTAPAIARPEIEALLDQMIEEAKARLSIPALHRVLLLPPDVTRAMSGAGWMAEHLYNTLTSAGAEVHVIPALGQHVPLTEDEKKWMFGTIPSDRIHVHDWQNGTTHLGAVPADYVKNITSGAADWEIPVELNNMVVGEQWDLIVTIGQVVPHEVLGFANHNKNYFVGLGSADALGASHLAAAMCGIENTLGNLVTPVRKCFNYAEDTYLGGLPDVYVQVVLKDDGQGSLTHTGVFVGDDFETYLEAAKLSRDQNITAVDEPFDKVVAFMRPDEYHATWVANKAVYRTRMAMADGGELLIIAPGVERFGEQPGADAIIRKYGYISTSQVLALYQDSPDMQANRSAVAHLMHGAPEGRFKVTYAPGHLTREEIESVGYGYMDVGEALARYNPDDLHDGYNTMPDGERIFFISNPAAGLWSTKERLYNRPGETE